MVMSKVIDRAVQLPGADQQAKGQRKSKPKMEELLIEEILRAAGLDPLD